MRIAPVGPVSSAIHTQALAAVEGALIAALTDNASIATAAARAQAASPDAPQTAPAKTAPPPPHDPARVAVDQAKAAAAGTQTSLAPMFADLAAALNAPETPPQLRTALANVLALRTPVGATFTGPQLQQAVSQSGVMLEAKLAAGLAPGRDLKAALLNLLGGLRSLPPPTETAAPVARQPLAQQAGMLTAEPQLPDVDAPYVETPRTASSRAETRPPPPFRDAALNPQRAEVSSLPAVRAGEVAPRLAAEVEHAVARQVLHQIASLPQGSSDGAAWMFELPFLTPQGAMLAQFAIQRDGTGQGHAAQEAGPTWRARFALEVDPLGPVHVDLRMGGGQRSHVTLWAGEAGLARMAPDSDLLSRTLDADVALRPGAPVEGVQAAPGQFVDRRS